MRWTTAVGIAVGGAGGAIAALLGSAAPAPTVEPPDEAPTVQPPSPVIAPPASVAAPPASSGSAGAQPVSGTPPPTRTATEPPAVLRELPTTPEALLRAQVNCDRLKDFDECTRASLALELGNTGPADPQQAKRFQKIALTHMVAQCESGSPHACFVLAAKFRAGTDLAPNPARAESLEKRARDLCRFRSAPECPRP